MVFNRHLKALNRCNHSDTIACVLYELLVNLELINVGLETHEKQFQILQVIHTGRKRLCLSDYRDLTLLNGD